MYTHFFQRLSFQLFIRLITLTSFHKYCNNRYQQIKSLLGKVGQYSHNNVIFEGWKILKLELLVPRHAG